MPPAPDPENCQAEEGREDKQAEAIEGWNGVRHGAVRRHGVRCVGLAVGDSDGRPYSARRCGNYGDRMVSG